MGKKILISISNLNIGGIQRVLLNTIKELKDDGHHVTLVVAYKHGTLEEEIQQGVDVHYLYEKSSIFLKLIDVFNLSFFYKKFKSTENYDLGIAYDGYSNISDYIIIKTRLPKKISWVHSDYQARLKADWKFQIKYFFMKRKYKQLDHFIAVSNDSAESFKSLNVVDNNKVDYVWNIVDGKSIIEKATAQSPVTLTGEFNVVLVGRLVFQKNYHSIIEIAKIIKKANLPIKFYIIGGGPLNQTLSKDIKKNNVGDYVTLLGSFLNPYPILKQADLYVTTSLIEGLQTTLLESATLGIPVIAFKNPGIREVCSQIIPDQATLVTTEEAMAKEIINHYQHQKPAKVFDYETYNKNNIKRLDKILGGALNEK